ncbi:unnamed protein product [Paramecium primaurelia]|uniref:Transmembrane protein n=1 Tax=Paramecium primaurelia TaxID=5886 RepID=A0A8S1PJG3_PARPR|nr:unnamed protein product [Paramecium primaurelia]
MKFLLLNLKIIKNCGLKYKQYNQIGMDIIYVILVIHFLHFNLMNWKSCISMNLIIIKNNLLKLNKQKLSLVIIDVISFLNKEKQILLHKNGRTINIIKTIDNREFIPVQYIEKQ